MIERSSVSDGTGWLTVVIACVLLTAVPAAAQESGGDQTGESSGSSAETSEEAGSEETADESDGGGDAEATSSDEAEATEKADEEQTDGGGDTEGQASDQNEPSDRGDAAGNEGEYPKEVYEPAWARYREAFVTLAAGDREKALEQLKSLEKKYEGHAAALFARPVIERLESSIAEEATDYEPEGTQSSRVATANLPPSKTDRLELERPTGLSRAELVSFQTLHGIAFGGELCAAARCFSSTAVIGSLILGGATGLGASLYATRDGITPGRAGAINAGTIWGFGNALALNIITDNFAGGTVAGSILPLAAGQLLGTGGGYLAGRYLRPHAGDVAMANSGGLWAGLFTGLFTVTAGLQGSPRGLVSALLVTSNLGIVSGGYLASQHPMPRGRVYVINTGGMLGGLLGVGTAVLFSGGVVGPQVAGGMTMLGAGGGLALSTVLTSDWPLDDGNERAGLGDTSLFVHPTRTGEGGVISIGGEF